MAKSAKGKNVNMEALMLANQNMVALGNARMNARGDLLGSNGKVVKTREQLAKEYNTKPSKPAVSAPVTSEVLTKVKAADKKPAQPQKKTTENQSDTSAID